jgi:hypothetical protein
LSASGFNQDIAPFPIDIPKVRFADKGRGSRELDKQEVVTKGSQKRARRMSCSVVGSLLLNEQALASGPSANAGNRELENEFPEEKAVEVGQPFGPNNGHLAKAASQGCEGGDAQGQQTPRQRDIVEALVDGHMAESPSADEEGWMQNSPFPGSFSTRREMNEHLETNKLKVANLERPEVLASRELPKQVPGAFIVEEPPEDASNLVDVVKFKPGRKVPDKVEGLVFTSAALNPLTGWASLRRR